MAATPNIRIIINGDDFGMSPGINQAIKELHQLDRLNSVSIMVNTPWSEDALTYARENSNSQPGLHLNLTTCRPLLPPEKVPSLVDSDGVFYRLQALLPRIIAGRVRHQEIQAEITAQMELYLSFGLQPLHIDSHQHLHAVPSVANQVSGLMSRYGVNTVRNPDFSAFVIPPSGRDRLVERAVRQTSRNVIRSTQERIAGRSSLLNGPASRSDRLIYLRWFVEQAADTLTTVRASLVGLENCTLEIIAHPAMIDDTLPAASNYVQGRQQELAFLKSDRFFTLLQEFQE